MTLAWGVRITAAQRALVVALCARIGIEPSWLMAIMWFESKLNPAARNPSSGATGLIQFMPNGSIKELGTTPEALAAMTFEQQLVYVERYFVERGYAGRMNTLADAYMGVFWPAAIGRPDDVALITDATSKAYVQNRGLDVDKDGRITKAEAAGYIVRALAEGLVAGNVTEESARPPAATHSTPNQGKGKTMDGLLAGLAGELLQKVVGAFAPAARAQLEQAAAKATDEDAKTTLGKGLLAVLTKVTGLTDPLQAAAAVTADNPAAKAKLAAVEQGSLAYLDQIAPLLDKVAQYEQARWKANDESADKAAARGQKDKVDIAPVLVAQSAWAFAVAAAAILVLLGVQTYFDSGHKPDPTLMGFLGILIYGVVRMMDRPSAYRFGGAFESDATATGNKAINQALDERRAGSKP